MARWSADSWRVRISNHWGRLKITVIDSAFNQDLVAVSSEEVEVSSVRAEAFACVLMSWDYHFVDQVISSELLGIAVDCSQSSVFCTWTDLLLQGFATSGWLLIKHRSSGVDKDVIENPERTVFGQNRHVSLRNINTKKRLGKPKFLNI